MEGGEAGTEGDLKEEREEMNVEELVSSKESMPPLASK